MTQMYPELWDDTDHRIVALRLQDHKAWRTIGREVNLNHETCRERFYRAMARITTVDAEERRQEESDRLDSYEEKLALLLAVAVDIDDNGKPTPHFDPAEARAILAKMLDVHTARAKLHGLHQPNTPADTDPVDAATKRIADALDRYKTTRLESPQHAPHPTT